MSRLVLLLLITVAIAIPAVVVASACSPYVDPCACGLCPKIVDCATQQNKAECFCGGGGRAPGVYAAPPMPNNGTATTQDPSRFFMCGVRAPSNVHTGVEMRCPYPLIFNATQRACV
jgi:hypothetical protein